jgi:hypothetical protein
MDDFPSETFCPWRIGRNHAMRKKRCSSPRKIAAMIGTIFYFEAENRCATTR